MSVSNLRHLARSAADAQHDINSRTAVYRVLEEMAKEISALRKEVDELKQKQADHPNFTFRF
ncbi:hypothetical protein [Bradyrhizobium lupini]|uniref:hypothetical protein n=1 Tax=Rhizobium lupini TaxID=136996 RepID=UPI000FFB5703